MELEDDGDDLERYTRLLDRTRRLYRLSARRVARREATRGDQIGELIDRFDNLHRGLVVRIYVTVCGADEVWTAEELELGEALFEHAWSKRLRGDQLGEAIRHAERSCEELDWPTLVGPFRQYGCLHEEVADLETLVVRQANLIARADGSLAPREQDAIHEITESMRSGLSAEARRAKPAPPAETSPPSRREATASTTEPEEATRSFEEVLAELDQLIGLETAKRELRSLSNYIGLQQRRKTAGLPATDIGLHLVFAGNPGTGKTTVARLFGEAMRAMGVLDNGQLIETDRSGLVAEYAGQTGPRTHERVDEALDGVLFIDEAYSLVSDEGDDPFGREAVQTLLKRAEDDRHRLSVILAGYPEPMGRLLDTNPGLASRFSRTIEFNDYQPVELGQIFGRLIERQHYRLTPEARLRVIQAITAMHAGRDESFGNGRAVRNLFEESILRMANRLADLPQASHDELVTFQPSDIPCDEAVLELEAVRLRVACPECDQRTSGGGVLLGSKVRCGSCNASFRLDWCELAESSAQ